MLVSFTKQTFQKHLFSFVFGIMTESVTPKVSWLCCPCLYTSCTGLLLYLNVSQLCIIWISGHWNKKKLIKIWLVFRCSRRPLPKVNKQGEQSHGTFGVTDSDDAVHTHRMAYLFNADMLRFEHMGAHFDPQRLPNLSFAPYSKACCFGYDEHTLKTKSWSKLVKVSRTWSPAQIAHKWKWHTFQTVEQACSYVQRMKYFIV